MAVFLIHRRKHNKNIVFHVVLQLVPQLVLQLVPQLVPQIVPQRCLGSFCHGVRYMYIYIYIYNINTRLAHAFWDFQMVQGAQLV